VGDAARARQGAERARRTTPLHAEAARSGDMGFTYGRYEQAPDGEAGPHVRVWARARAGAGKGAVERNAAKRWSPRNITKARSNTKARRKTINRGARG